MSTLLIDIGASRIKWKVLESGKTGSSISPIFDCKISLPHLYTVAVNNIINEAQADGDKVENIFMCTEMGGAIVTDRQGYDVTPYISWKADDSAMDFIDLAILKFSSKNLKLLTLPEWICISSGGIATLACRHHRFTMQRFEKYSELYPTNEADMGRGAFSIHGRPIPVYFIGDTQAALLGAGFMDDFMRCETKLYINIGTGSQVLRTGNTIPMTGRVELSGVTHIPAGRVLNVFHKFIPGMWDIMADLKRSEVIAASEHIGMGLFRGAEGDKGFISFITENTTPRTLCASIVKTMTYNYSEAQKKADPMYQCREAKLFGGIAQKIPVLQRVLEERLCIPVNLIKGESAIMGLECLQRSKAPSTLPAYLS